jgi:DNA repair exonuclease SbcCD nuclease subunit
MDNFSLIINEAMKPDVDLFIHAGDLYNRSKPPDTVIKETQTLLFQLAVHKPVIIIPGNHERSLLKASLLNSFSDIHIFNRPKTLEIEINGFSIGITGFPFVRHDFPKKFTSILKKTGHDVKKHDYKILIMHQLLDTATVGIHNYTFNMRNPEVLPLAMIPNSFDYIAMGHVHRYQRIFPVQARRNPVIYPGSIERTSFTEVNEQKGYIIADSHLNVDKKTTRTNVKFIELPSRNMYLYKLHVDERNGTNLEKGLSGIESKFQLVKRDSLIYIRIIGSLDRSAWTLLRNRKLAWKGKYGFKKLSFKIVQKNQR